MGETTERRAVGGGTRDGADTPGASAPQDGNPAAEARATDDHESNRATGAGMTGVLSPSRASSPAPAPQEDAESPAQRGAGTPESRPVGVPPAKSWRGARKG
jgi:hypothetical protein